VAEQSSLLEVDIDVEAGCPNCMKISVGRNLKISKILRDKLVLELAENSSLTILREMEL
jgi:hypothetical protein